MAPSMDPANKGMQRAQIMSSLNAASMVQVQGDWSGTSPARILKDDGSVDKFGAGPLLVSRRGQLACFDLLQTAENYNFVIVATSGSGKSFFANEIVCDFLSKGGIARLIDVGRSYHRFCEIMGGQNVVFSPKSPMSLNPFTGVRTELDLDDIFSTVKELIRLMCFPLQDDKDVPAWEYSAIENGIRAAWLAKNEHTELADIYDWFLAQNDARAKDLAYQLEAFVKGRYAKWFAGPRTVNFSSPLVVIELEELKADPQLQTVVMSLVINHVGREMYLSDRSLPKLLAIDEAWDLLGGMRTGKFIETSFRRARKYNGIAGVITQSFEDFEKSEAAKAAIANASWQFVLRQKSESLEFAKAAKRIVGDEATFALMRSIKPGDGFSEIFVRGERGSGLYRFVVDRHSYYTFTTSPRDVPRIDALVREGVPLADAIDQLAQADYKKKWGGSFKAAA